MKKHLLLLGRSFKNHGGTLPTKSLGRFLSIVLIYFLWDLNFGQLWGPESGCKNSKTPSKVDFFYTNFYDRIVDDFDLV